MRVATTLFGLIIMATSNAAAAREWSKVGSWTIVQSEAACSAGRLYGSGTLLTVTHTAAGEVIVAASNEEWRAHAHDRVAIRYRLGEHVYPSAPSVGMLDGGVTVTMDADFLRDMAAAPELVLEISGLPVATLDLDGSSAAVGTLETCRSALPA